MKDYTEFSTTHHLNVIPEADFKELVSETFTDISSILRATYGPYGSSVIISEMGDTMTTKDGYNAFNALGPSHNYKKMVYLAIKKIIDRVNKNVGDGTTSCILLADKMFRNIESIISTPDEKRQLLKIFDDIESELQDPASAADFKSFISPLRDEHFENIISLASNYDDRLTSVIMDAFDPKFDDKGLLISKRNIITETQTVDGGNISYETQQLPGKYRARINMDGTFARALAIPSKMKVIVFDHSFTQSDWAQVTENYDKETPVLIVATGFTRGFLDNEYLRYLKERGLVHKPASLVLAEMKGTFVQYEIQDFAAVIKQKPFSLNTHMNVNYNEIPFYDVQVFGGNCLCLDNVEPPTEYIEDLKYEMKKDLTKSIAKKNNFLERINALEMKAEDTLLTVKAPTSLEAKLIADKIDDCVSIINSAAENGVVPNMFRYGYYRIEQMRESTDGHDTESLHDKINTQIMYAIEGLFRDIWRSKYGETEELSLEEHIDAFYTNWTSFDIIDDEFCEPSKFCTSSQYDIEVIVAAISIVKYLITSKALIFDASLLRQNAERPLLPV